MEQQQKMVEKVGQAHTRQTPDQAKQWCCLTESNKS